MFCSWKSRPDAPCACAYRLHGALDELLNHLCCLGEGTFILRRPGLSLVKNTRFGLHIRERSCDWNILRDAISGLETDLSQPQQAYLLREFPDQCPLFAIAPEGKPVEFTVRLQGHAWGSSGLLGMIKRFDGTTLDCVESHRLGAGAWLDEWEQPSLSQPCPGGSLPEISSLLQTCRLLEVEVRTTAQRGETCFCPSFIDNEGSILRIADRHRTHVVYADIAVSGFHLEQAGRHAFRLSHHD